MALEKELETYKLKLPELRDREGKFVLIHRDQMVDVYETYVDAVKAGYEQFKLEPFLVKRIDVLEQVQYVTRLLDLPTCHI